MIMKLNYNILTRFAPVVLLCAAISGMAGCTQGEDALQGAGTVAQGGEPIHVSVAPKPGFTGGTDTAGGSGTGTRATVGDDGTFGWVEGTDKIYVDILFNDPIGTRYQHSWTPLASATNSYITGWKVLNGWDGATTEFSGDLVWPLGASSVSIAAFYTDCTLGSRRGSNADEAIQLLYNNGATGDHMIFEKNRIPLGGALTVDFGHATTRLVFTGLKATTAYSLKAGGAALTFPTYVRTRDFKLLDEAAQTFASDADGKLVICAALDAKLNASTHKVTLDVVEGDVTSGPSAGTVELTARGSDADGWKMDGYMYTVNFANGSGTVNPDNKPDLLKPAPIVANNTVYAVNGYWVTAPDADASKKYQWAASSTATVMDSDPCAGHGDWRMPTMKDFEKMAGWTASNPWSQGANSATTNIDSNKDAWNTAFPYGDYWSSVARSSDSGAWGMYSGGNGTANYNWTNKTTTRNVRCVQPQ